MDCTAEEIRNDMIYQIGALQGFCRAHGAPLRHVKPHGALYLTAVENEAVARAVAEAIVAVDPHLFFVALAGSKGAAMRRIGEEIGLKVVYEAFPDRMYTADGTLVSRKKPGAVVKDPETVAARALSMARDHQVVAEDGTVIPLEVQTLCVHGDNPSAIALVRAIRQTLEAEGIRIRSMGI